MVKRPNSIIMANKVDISKIKDMIMVNNKDIINNKDMDRRHSMLEVQDTKANTAALKWLLQALVIDQLRLKRVHQEFHHLWERMEGMEARQ